MLFGGFRVEHSESSPLPNFDESPSSSGKYIIEEHDATFLHHDDEDSVFDWDTFHITTEARVPTRRAGRLEIQINGTVVRAANVPASAKFNWVVADFETSTSTSQEPHHDTAGYIVCAHLYDDAGKLMDHKEVIFAHP